MNRDRYAKARRFATPAEADLLSWDFIQDPYLTYREMRTGTGPQWLAIRTLSKGLHAWLVTEYGDVRRLLAESAAGVLGALPRAVRTAL